MPPSPEVTCSLNQAAWDRACADLGIEKHPSVKFTMSTGGGKWMGVYRPGPDSIEVFMGWDQYERDRLMSAMNEAGRTLLHELRHAWQYRTWSKSDLDDVVKKETDARDWEDEAIARYRGIVRITRKQHNSPFSRLDKAQHRVRRDV